MSEPINDIVNHPSHYTSGPDLGRLECLDITRWMPFTLGNAFKYVFRAGKKDPTRFVEDLQKARFYLLEWKSLLPWRTTLYHGRAPAEAFLLKTDARQWESWRYRALRAIVCGNAEEACDVIEEQIKAAESYESYEAEAEAERAAATGVYSNYEPEDETYDD